MEAAVQFCYLVLFSISFKWLLNNRKTSCSLGSLSMLIFPEEVVQKYYKYAYEDVL